MWMHNEVHGRMQCKMMGSQKAQVPGKYCFTTCLIIHLPPASVARGRTERSFRKEDPARTVEKDNRSLLMHSRR